MLEAMLDTLVTKVVDEGMRADSGYKPQVWAAVVTAVNQVAVDNQQVDKAKCVNKHDACKEDWKLWQALTSLSGFARDEDGFVVADSEVVKKYFEAHPKARKFGRSPLQFEEQHRQLFTGVTATGESSRTIDAVINSVESRSRSDTEVSWSESPSPAPSDISDSDGSDTRRRQRANTSSTPKPRGKRPKKETSVDRFSAQMSRIADELSGLVKTLNKDYQQSAIAVFIQEYRILDEALQFAMINLMGTEFLAKTFLALPRGPQKRWVRNQLLQLSATGSLEYDNFAYLCEQINWEGDGVLELKNAV
jgi:hypothetical protein